MLHLDIYEVLFLGSLCSLTPFDLFLFCPRIEVFPDLVMFSLCFQSSGLFTICKDLFFWGQGGS